MGNKTITVSYPITVEKGEGIKPIKESDIIEAVKFQLKNLLLTRPGEKISDPDFGIGLSNFLFSQESLRIPDIKARINQQINTYMNYFDSLTIDVKRSIQSDKTITVYLRFVIEELKIKDELEVSV
jgi:phage baseplate assembly protein W